MGDLGVGSPEKNGSRASGLGKQVYGGASGNLSRIMTQILLSRWILGHTFSTRTVKAKAKSVA